MESPSGFLKLIKHLPKDFTVLDVGSGGLQGENTTEYLAEHFLPENILGICRSEHEVGRYQAIRAEKKLIQLNIILDDFYTHDFSHHAPFDLVVLDMNIENNLAKDWSDQGLARVRGLVKPGGYLINYIMLTDQYGDPKKTPAFIRDTWRKNWGTDKLTSRDIDRRMANLKGWEVFAHDIEERRDYILWIML